jgi:hypothetical protein
MSGVTSVAGSTVTFTRAQLSFGALNHMSLQGHVDLTHADLTMADLSG